MDLKLNLVVVEVALHLLAVDIEDVGVHNRESSPPSFVALCKIRLAWVKDAVNESKIVFDLFVALDMEAIGRFRHSSLEVRHSGSKLTNESVSEFEELKKELDFFFLSKKGWEMLVEAQTQGRGPQVFLYSLQGSHTPAKGSSATECSI